MLFLDKITDADNAEAVTADFKAVAEEVIAAVPAGADAPVAFALGTDADEVRVGRVG